jgi:hypothetical protein
MKINKNKVKYLIFLLPVALLWVAFYIGHLLGIGEGKWWSFPYLVTGLLSIAASVIYSINVVDKYYTND